VDNSGVSGFLQFGANNSNTMLVRQFFGTGLTGFGLVPGRPKDSVGCGLAWGWLNTDPNAGAFFFPDAPGPSKSLRSNEAILQAYYQVFVRQGVFVEPVVTYVPNPGERPGIPAAWAMTVQLTLLF
jgi:porin